MGYICSEDLYGICVHCYGPFGEEIPYIYNLILIIETTHHFIVIIIIFGKIYLNILFTCFIARLYSALLFSNKCF